jgi:cytochrome c-type biogenesis protein CcmH
MFLALAFVLPPLLQRPTEIQKASGQERKQTNIAIYRDQLSELETDLSNGIVNQQQYDQDRDEIERRLLEDAAPDALTATSSPKIVTTSRGTVYALALGLPVIAVIFYLKVGDPNSMTKQATAAPAVASTGTEAGSRSQEQIEANVTALAKRLQTNPSDAQGWTMLARSYSSMERFGEASGAYAKATELTPNDADLWAEYAFASAMANGRRLAGKPMELINRALKVDPDNAKALQLAGSAAFEAKDYKKAIDYWQRVLSKVPPTSEVGQAITGRINEAKALAAGK